MILDDIWLIMFDMKFSDWLIEHMKEKEWSQADLARKSGLTRAAVNNYVLGSGMPNLNALIKLAKAFKMLPSALFAIATSEPSFKDPRSDEILCKFSTLDEADKSIVESIFTRILDVFLDRREKRRLSTQRTLRS
jgi:transcriptional regulator with XRE-family HTH domain